MNCRKLMCGGACGVQWMDEEERARRGYVFSLEDLHPNGQEEFKQTNKERVLICFLCGSGGLKKRIKMTCFFWQITLNRARF